MQKANTGLQIPMDKMSSKWTVIALDMRTLLSQDKGAHFKFVRSIQFCGNLRTRGTYASDIKYGLIT